MLTFDLNSMVGKSKAALKTTFPGCYYAPSANWITWKIMCTWQKHKMLYVWCTIMSSHLDEQYIKTDEISPLSSIFQLSVSYTWHRLKQDEEEEEEDTDKKAVNFITRFVLCIIMSSYLDDVLHYGWWMSTLVTYGPWLSPVSKQAGPAHRTYWGKWCHIFKHVEVMGQMWF